MEKQLAEILWRSLGKPDGASLPTELTPTLMTDDERERGSSGRVKKPETINYRTCQPEKDGLFDEEIFGKLVEEGHEEDANAYREALERSVSDRARGDEQMDSQPRCSRFGHIALAAPVVHPWLRGSSLLEELCELNQKQIEQLLCCESVLVDGDAPQIVESNPAEAPNALYCGAALRRWIEHRGHDTGRLFLSIIGVLPPDLRPLVPLDSGSFASSDLNELYRRVINRNNRAKRLIDLNAPVVIVYNEVRLLQNAVDALFDNASTANPLVGPNDRQLKSLTDLLNVGSDEHGSWEAVGRLESLVADSGSEVLEAPLPAWLFRYVRYLRSLGVALAPAGAAASDPPAALAPVPL